MTCAEIQAGLSLYLYGELDFAAEEIVEDHLNDCAFCQLSLEREKEWHAALNRHQQDVRPEWLAACRVDLRGQVDHEPTSMERARHVGVNWLRGFLDFRFTERSYRLAGISFLVILGFGAGRLVDFISWPGGPRATGDVAGFLQSPQVTQVQQIRPESGNRVRIILQRTQVREVSGSRDDDGVRSLLVGAVLGSIDPGIRMDSVAMLAGQNGVEIRNAIVNTVKNDSNAAVRMKAVELLRQFPGDPVTREALEFALAHDRDAGVRTEAMDVLVPAQGNFHVTPELLKTISDVMQSAQGDDYLHFRCAQILSAQASSNGIY